MITLDRLDLRILEQLQHDAKGGHAALAEAVHLSPSQVSRRVHRLEDEGIIKGYAAVLDPEVLGLDVEAHTLVSLERHDLDYGEAFERGIQAFDEILDCLSVTGEADYILRIVAPNLHAFARFLSDKLMKLPGVKTVRSNIGLRRIKSGFVLPLDTLTRSGDTKRKVSIQDVGVAPKA